MKVLFLVALLPFLALATNNSENDNAVTADTDDTANKNLERMDTLSALLETHSDAFGEETLEVGWGRRRRRWHAHWPHGHAPHGHRPHVHWPHGHVPHGHRPHVHWPHGHIPHVHWPHAHVPHIHVPVEKWAKDAIQPIPDELRKVLPSWVQDILDTLDDIVSDPGKAIAQAAEVALEAVGQAIASATSAIKNLCTSAIDAANYVVKHYIGPVIQELKDIVGEIEGKVTQVTTSVDIINGFFLDTNKWFCPTAKTQTYSFTDIPQMEVCIPTSITDRIKMALTYIYNAITGSNVHWQSLNLACNYNFGMAFTQDGGLSASAGTGVGVNVGAGVGVSRGVAFGCVDGAYMAGFLLATDRFVEVSVGGSSPVEAELGTSITVQFFPGEAKCGGWACIPGFTFEFSVGVEAGAFGGDLDAAFVIITSVPSFNFGCNTQDECTDHISFGSCPVCASTNAFCGLIDWMPYVRCTGSNICLENVPRSMYCHGCSWDFMGIAVSVSFGATTTPVKLQFSLAFAIGFTTVPLTMKIASYSNPC